LTVRGKKEEEEGCVAAPPVPGQARPMETAPAPAPAAAEVKKHLEAVNQCGEDPQAALDGLTALANLATTGGPLASNDFFFTRCFLLHLGPRRATSSLFFHPSFFLFPIFNLYSNFFK